MHMRHDIESCDQGGEDQEQSLSSFVTISYLSYIWGVDYKGLNGSHICDLPHGPKYRVHPQVNNV